MSDTPTPKNPIDTLIPIMYEAIGEWLRKHDAESVRRQVFRILDDNHKTITMKLLGFDVRYDKEWQVDHCNGRGGQSAAGDYISKMHKAAIDEWLGKLVLPTLTAAQEKRIIKSINDRYVSEVGQQIWKVATKQAEITVNNLMTEIAKSHTADNYGRLMAMIAGKPFEENAA